ncbi:uroporphyrinogen-III synthase [Roseomonas marmotae]|uniref:Uroporphyrinogen-III synthase n=1 Tax=Roseomonas marmotae TaxID=2768161 RepID=A0ABS3KFV9_9PROT|nr:uroporphyrinogen-III synthase [Roseomonas marmotae]MBO1076360.1 uroporphyrinogen-III synthase [Roseomonas marmotae]QTI80591.1 uroporphyrinogen-III synthase [Roseomonas marmotae]
MTAPAVLVTRPEPGAAETAAAVAALGWRPLLAPALVLAPLPPPADLTAPAQALLLPSRAAARALPGVRRDLPVLAVGPGTAEEARAAGFTCVSAASGDAVSLTAEAARSLDPRAGPLLLAVGRGYSDALAASLRGHGFAVRRRVVYAARPADSLSAEAAEALRAGEVRAALFFSPRSASVTMALLRRAGLAETVGSVAALALSARIATALAGLSWQTIRATPTPEPMALMALLGPAHHPAVRPDREGQEKNV